MSIQDHVYRSDGEGLSKLNFTGGLSHILLVYVLDFEHMCVHTGSILSIKTTLLNYFQLNTTFEVFSQ